MLRIGLTGGIASGKSEAARRFAELGVPVLDADAIAHELVAPGQPLLDAVLGAFGPSVRLPDGSLDRAALGRLVFADPAERRRLEAITHPAIRAELAARTARLDAPYVVLMIPLLVETGMTGEVDRVLVIDAPEAEQRRRITARDRHDAAHIARILSAQATRQDRLAAADDVIVNDGEVADLHRAVDALHQRYLALAAAD